MHRFLKIDGVHNFRDFGIYKTKTGREIRKATLFRSGHLSGLTENGKEEFASLGIKTVIDLRRPHERNHQPNNLPDGIKTLFADIKINDGEKLPAHLQYLKDENISAQKTRDFMLETYRRLPFEAPHLDIFRQSFAALLPPQTPLLIHCAAGKDRTGILCALILHVIGVHDDDIMHDYLLTNQVPNLDELIENYAASISKRIGKTIQVNAMRPLGIVDEEYLHNAFATINDKHGSVLNFLATLGVTYENITIICENTLS